ncbi:aldo/keto reductase [Nocardiopsis sp. MG754419]|uniref:aldo/keto reductase n=1 Tax=Nocardiopsis sp. MG754419 TaxID=2259865 RepID=UPI001BA772EA|nr:aldo/keto reductase [Nocardiopsis sp. MG754419]MBR8742972.1 aldo/keto reductase [Nocardiopsis sp. MG754419]
MTPAPARGGVPPHVAFTRLGLGTAPLGNLGREVDDATSAAVVDTAWERGTRFFDTAPHYGLGLAERRLGQALTGRPRDDYVLATKVGRLLRPHPRPTGSDLAQGFAVPDTLTRERDYSASGVLRGLEGSLARLGTDRVDVVWIHDPEEDEDRCDQALREAVPALERLRDEGVIAAWGVGSKDTATLLRFVVESAPDLVMAAGRYTLLEQEPAGLMRACRDHRVGVVAVGVFNSGLLAHDDPPEDAWYEYAPAPTAVRTRARALARVARRHGVRLPAAALAFPGRHPAVVNVTVGARTAAEIDTDHSLFATPVPEAFWTELRSRGLLKEEA